MSLVVVAVALAGCGDSQASGGETEPSDTTVAALVAKIGVLDGPEEYLFGDITSVTADSDGRIYVADRIGSSIRAYDSTGRHLARIGREGEGPGEFQRPNDLVFDPQGRLFVRDGVRITTLERSAESRLPDSAVQIVYLPGWANLSSRRARTDGVQYFYPHYYFPFSGPDRYFYLVFDSTGFVGDTISVPPMQSLQNARSAVIRGRRRMVPGLNRAPFEPGASWDLTRDGHVISTTGLQYRVVETDGRGDTVREFTGPVGGRKAVPTGERSDSIAALQKRIDSLGVPLEEVEGVSTWIREGTVPDSLPAITGLHVSGDGKIWVGRWPAEGRGSAVFDVFTRSGEYQRTVVVPAPLMSDPPPYLSDDVIVGVIQDTATDVEFVLVFREP